AIVRPAPMDMGCAREVAGRTIPPPPNGGLMQKRIRRSGALRPKRVAIAVSAAFLPWMAAHDAWADPAANQLPTGAQVGAGTVSISTSGTKMQIDQASDRAIINWQN